MNRFIVAVLALGLSASLLGAQSKDKSKPARQPATPWIAKGEPITLRSGLKYWDIVVGEGFEAVRGKRVRVHYSGYFMTGQKFDSSVERGEPLEFRIGDGQVIRGWEEGVVGMKIGGKRKLRIPPDLAYGREGYPGAIPPNSTLTFDIELLAVR